MPARKVILATGETYHIFNRSLKGIPIFTNKYEYRLFLECIEYYSQETPPIKFSHFRKNRSKYNLLLESNKNNKLVTILAYCIMPTHFHFLLTQEKEKGIMKFIQKISNSYAHYFNIKHEQKGPVFESKFKAVRVITQEQLIHLNRYIHLNPVTSYITENPENYEFSSYKAYLYGNNQLVDRSIVMSEFSSPESYEDFVMDQKDYQRQLQQIKHLLIE